jgi:hypothetical protein
MADAKKKETKKEIKKEVKEYKITKSNGKVVVRNAKYCGDIKLARMKKKGWKVEEK